MEEPAKNLFEALQVTPLEENDAAGTITKRGENVVCFYLTKVEKSDGLYRYSCLVEMDLKGKARQHIL